MKLVLQVQVVIQGEIPSVGLLRHSHFQKAATAHLLLQQTPLHVIFNGLKEQVVLVHVPLLVGTLWLDIIIGFHLSSSLLLQGQVPQQAGHHDGLVHVVGSCYEAVHDVDKGVLVAG